MKKTPLLIGVVMVSAVAGGSFAYGWHSVNKMPGRAQTPEVVSPIVGITQEEAAAPSNTSPVVMDRSVVASQLSNITSDNGQISLTLDEAQLNQLVNDAIVSQPQVAPMLANVRSLHTTFNSDSIETGAVLNLSELPTLPAELQTGLDQLTRAAPMLANRDIYLGIVTRPRVQDGQISLDQDLNIKVGQFTLPLADVAESMGISVASIEQQLNTIITQRGLNLDTIQIVDEQLVITGTKL